MVKEEQTSLSYESSPSRGVSPAPPPKRGRGRPRGSKNKTPRGASSGRGRGRQTHQGKPSLGGPTASSRHSRPSGSKNRRSRTVDPLAPGSSRLRRSPSPTSSSSPEREREKYWYGANNGYHYFMVPIYRVRDSLRLPTRFTELMEEKKFIQATVYENTNRSVIPYKVEIAYDEDGNSWFEAGWTEFRDDYDIQPGCFLQFAHRVGTHDFYCGIIDGTGCLRVYP